MRVAMPAAIAAVVCMAQPDGAVAKKAAAVGDAMSAELERNSKVFGDPVVASGVDRIAGRLRPGGGVRVRVLDDSQPRVAVFPGGRVYVSTGLIASTESEAELAGVLAHLAAHSVLWRGLPVANAGTLPVIFMGSAFDGLCNRFHEGRGLVPKGYEATEAQREQEADAAAVRYLYDAGWDAEGLVDYFERRGVADGAVQRRAAVSALPQKAESVVSSLAFAELRARCAAAPVRAVVRRVPTRRRP